MTNLRLKFIQQFTDRHGHPRLYFRRPGYKRVALPGLPGSPEFMAAYQAALDGVTARKVEIGATRMVAGTMHWLVGAYLSSQPFSALAPETQRTRRNILENVREADGDKRIFHTVNGKHDMLLAPRHLQTMINKKANAPFAQRNLLNTLRAMFRWAMSEGKLPDDPTLGVTRQKIRTEGYATWTKADIEQFIACHPIGTKAYLAFMLFLDTGQRRGDVARMGRQHIHNGWLTIKQRKTGMLVELPVTDALRAAIDAAPNNHLTFLVTEQGQPFSDAGLTNWFRKRCKEAGLPKGLSAHGLRKARAKRLADQGCTAHEIAAVTGHTSISEVQRYTQAADRRRLAARAMRDEVDATGEIKKTGA
jgi:integrase